jgi:hypothetical protein
MRLAKHLAGRRAGLRRRISGAFAQAPPQPPEQLPPPGECCLFSRAVNTCTRYSRECIEEKNGVCIRFKQPPECLAWELKQRCVQWGPCPQKKGPQREK